MNKYLQPENAPVTWEDPKPGYVFDTEADRAQVLDRHIKSFNLSKGTSGTPTLAVNSGSAQLASAGQIAVQTFSGSASLAVRVGTITYYFTPAGTL